MEFYTNANKFLQGWKNHDLGTSRQSKTRSKKESHARTMPL